MSVAKHPSVKPSAPRKPPATSTTDGHKNVMHTGSGQEGVPYGFRHEVNVKSAHKSERMHDFHDHKPGDQKSDDSPG